MPDNKILQVALYEVQIPLNLGAIMRTCACFNVLLHIIEPLGFVFTNKKSLGRAALDYEPQYILHHSFDDFLVYTAANRKIVFTPHTNLKIEEFYFLPQDILVFGREKDGIETHRMSQCDSMVSITMTNARSLNLAASVAIGINWTLIYLKNNYYIK
jgi:tRNA (cytidine/uridine-2'-O-)-methyltransferase